MRLTDEVAATLKYYVYAYIDPRNGETFYIGKGKDDRLFQHLDEQTDSEKVTRIADIRSEGHEPQIDILRYGLTDPEAVLVEATVIDLIGLNNLTNKQSGHHSKSYGRISSKVLIQMLSAEHCIIAHRALLVTINKLYRSDISDLELYEATRGFWTVGAQRNSVDFVMAVYQGIVLEVYRVDQWYPAGTLEYQSRDAEPYKGSGRWEFSGEVAHDVRDEYVGYSVGKGGQNPVRYPITRPIRVNDVKE